MKPKWITHKTAKQVGEEQLAADRHDQVRVSLYNKIFSL